LPANTLRQIRENLRTVRPSHPGYYFTPNYHSVGVTNHDVGKVNFVAHPRPLPPRRR
jgi:hypothetical protein